MSENVIKILGEAAPLLYALLVPVLAIIGKKLAQLIAAKVDSQLLRDALLKVSAVSLTVVKELAQVHADEFRAAAADGKLSAEEKAKLKSLAKDKLKSFLSLDEISRLIGSKDPAEIEKFLDGKIEEAVRDSKAIDALSGK